MTEQTQNAQSNEQKFETFDEQQFRQELDRDTFQKELDEAIKERRLSDIFPELYQFDAQFIEYSIKSQDVDYKHRVKNPSYEDEMRKETMSVTIRRNAGKQNGDDIIESVTDNAKALKRYYDGTALEVWGYAPSEDEDAEVWRDVKIVLEKPEAITDAMAKEHNLRKDKDGNFPPLTLLHFIPDADKLKVAELIHGGSCVVINERGKRIRSVRSKRQYIVKQLFGLDRNEDGTLSKPKNVVAYHFKEADAPAIGKFNTQAVHVDTLLKKDGAPEERRIISIGTCRELFAQHIEYIQGASINGVEVKDIHQGDPRLSAIPSACQRDALFVYMNFLKS